MATRKHKAPSGTVEKSEQKLNELVMQVGLSISGAKLTVDTIVYHLTALFEQLNTENEHIGVMFEALAEKAQRECAAALAQYEKAIRHVWAVQKAAKPAGVAHG